MCTLHCCLGSGTWCAHSLPQPHIIIVATHTSSIEEHSIMDSVCVCVLIVRGLNAVVVRGWLGNKTVDYINPCAAHHKRLNPLLYFIIRTRTLHITYNHKRLLSSFPV